MTEDKQEYRGVVVGGEDDGQVVSCSRPFYKHLGCDGKTYLQFEFNFMLAVWAPKDQPHTVTLAKMQDSYKLLHGDKLSFFDEWVDTRLKTMWRKWPKSTVRNIVERTGLSKHRVTMLRYVVQRERLLEKSDGS